MNAKGSLTIMNSRQVIAMVAVHTNLDVSEYPSVRGISVMEVPDDGDASRPIMEMPVGLLLTF